MKNLIALALVVASSSGCAHTIGRFTNKVYRETDGALSAKRCTLVMRDFLLFFTLASEDCEVEAITEKPKRTD